jgi:hypothetical protein
MDEERTRRRTTGCGSSAWSIAAWLCGCAIAGCPGAQHVHPHPVDAGTETDSASSVEGRRHGGLISIQDMSIVGRPEAGHGLSVLVDLAREPRAPDFEERPGDATGCRAWRYEVPGDPPPGPSDDEGAITIVGLRAADPLTCAHDGSTGYVCPVATGAGPATLDARDGGVATYTQRGASFSPEHVGLHLRIDGARVAANGGAFPIVGVPSADTLLVAAPRAGDEEIVGRFAILAGLGPVPGNPNDPIEDGDEITVSIAPTGRFGFGTTLPIAAGGAFALDDRSAHAIGAVPTDGTALQLGCASSGGACGPAYASIVLLVTTDGDIDGLPPGAMPPPSRHQVVIRCVELGVEGITVPADAMALVRDAHAAAPIRRIRTAFMRDGITLGVSPPPTSASPLPVAVGHGVLGFTDP